MVPAPQLSSPSSSTPTLTKLKEDRAAAYQPASPDWKVIPVRPTTICFMNTTHCSPSPSPYLANSYTSFKAPTKYSSSARPTLPTHSMPLGHAHPPSGPPHWGQLLLSVSHPVIPHLAETRFPPSQGLQSRGPSIQMCRVMNDYPHRDSSWASPNPLRHQEAKGLGADTTHERKTGDTGAAPLHVSLSCITEILES